MPEQQPGSQRNAPLTGFQASRVRRRRPRQCLLLRLQHLPRLQLVQRAVHLLQLSAGPALDAVSPTDREGGQRQNVGLYRLLEQPANPGPLRAYGRLAGAAGQGLALPRPAGGL